jgi:Skp family chaperone for outer membrane proteins
MQEEIFNPVKSKIYKAIEIVAKRRMQFVFDKSGDIILLYADTAFDITYKVLDRLKRGKYDDYEKRKLIMTDQTRAELEQELIKLEQQIADFRENKFGTNGELFQKQDELMKPVQNKIFTAIEEIALEDEYDYIFDRSGDIMLLFAKEEHDLTSRVIEKLKLE